MLTAPDRLSLSVIMPNYNMGPTIGRAIESVVSQSRLPDEFIILDDGSCDDSMDVIRAYADRYGFIRVMHHVKNLGFADTVRDMMDRVQMPYVYGMSADDRLRPGFFSGLMGMAQKHPEAGILFGQVIAFASSNTAIGSFRPSRWKLALYASPSRYLKEYLDVELPMHSLCGATLYKTEALRAVGGFRYEELGHWCDTFAARTIGLKCGVGYVPEAVLDWHVRPGSISQLALEDAQTMNMIVDRASALMRSDDFKDLYPSEYTRRWSKKAKRFIRIYSSPIVRAGLGGTRILMRFKLGRFILPHLLTIFRRVARLCRV